MTKEKTRSSFIKQLETMDRDLYASILFAPKTLHEALASLACFYYEIASIPTLVSDPMLGHIRLQWWSEQLHTPLSDLPSTAHPTLRAVLKTIDSYPLLKEDFLHYIRATEHALNPTGCKNFEQLRHYAEATFGFLLKQLITIMGSDPLEDGLIKAASHLIAFKHITLKTKTDPKQLDWWLPIDSFASEERQHAMIHLIDQTLPDWEAWMYHQREIPPSLYPIFYPVVLSIRVFKHMIRHDGNTDKLHMHRRHFDRARLWYMHLRQQL